jgi:hypothetical protein
MLFSVVRLLTRRVCWSCEALRGVKVVVVCCKEAVFNIVFVCFLGSVSGLFRLERLFLGVSVLFAEFEGSQSMLGASERGAL